jgi:hypothetical protein
MMLTTSQESMPNILVVFDPNFTEEEWVDGWEKHYPFKKGEVVLYLGEIRQMPGHVIVVKRNGQVFWGFHSENFRLATEDEV